MRSPVWISASIIGLGLVCLNATPLMAQQDLDAVTADSAHHKVVFENEEVRVVSYEIVPGDKTAMHSHPDNVSILFTDANAKITTADGKATESHGKAGAVAWRTATTHVVENIGDKPIAGVLVEPKKPHSARPAGTADETTFPNSVAKVEFENEQVRVFRYRVAPGQSSPMHGHPDNVHVILTETKAKVTSADGKMSIVVSKAREVIWRPAMQHAVQNVGDRPMEGIVVEMKGTPAMTSQ